MFTVCHYSYVCTYTRTCTYIHTYIHTYVRIYISTLSKINSILYTQRRVTRGPCTQGISTYPTYLTPQYVLHVNKMVKQEITCVCGGQNHTLLPRITHQSYGSCRFTTNYSMYFNTLTAKPEQHTNTPTQVPTYATFETQPFRHNET